MNWFKAVILSALGAVVRARVISHGKVATPVSFGRIHIFVPVSSFFVETDELEKLVGLANLTATTSIAPEVRERALNLTAKATDEIQRLRDRGDKLRDLLFRNSTAAAPARVKRMVPAMAAALPLAAGLGVGLGVAALGFAAANRVAIDNLGHQLSRTNERVDLMMTTVEANNAIINEDLGVLNATICDLAQDLDKREEKHLLSTLFTRLKIFSGHARQRQRDYERSLYAAFSGHLTPELVPLIDLARGLSNVEEYGKVNGLKMVEMNILETAFSQPLSVVTNETGMSIVIDVPMIPEELDVLDLLETQHSELHLDERTTVTMDFNDGLVLSDPQRRFHREVTAEELSLCSSFKEYRFCAFTLLYKEPRTCLSAYVLHDKEKIKALCERTLRRSEFNIHDNGNGTVSVRSTTDEVLRVECPHNSTLQGMFRTGGEEVTVAMPSGCYLDTPTLAYFRRQEDIDTALVVEPEIQIEDLLDGIPAETAAAAVKAIATMKGLKTIVVPVHEVGAYISTQDEEDEHSYDMTLAIGLGGAALTLVVLVAAIILGRLAIVNWRLRGVGGARAGGSDS